jgi:mRNA-degrading endonuclease toxin of MazEF toxin-antitoxin module
MEIGIQRGTIIFAEMRDPDGNLKKRPALVLSSQAKIDSGSDLVVAGISTRFTRPIQAGWFELAASPFRDPTTGLKRPSVVKSDFLATVAKKDVISVFGRAPASIVKQVLLILRDASRNP